MTGTRLTLTGLTNGTAYVFRVAATSSVGTGPVSDASAAITPLPDRPGHPQLVSARPAKGAATVSWLAPASDGGGAVTGYRVQYSTDGTTWKPVTHTGTSTTQKVTGLVDGTSYRFRVAAINAAGAGSFTTTVTAGSVTSGVIVPRGANVDAFLHHTTSHYGAATSTNAAANSETVTLTIT